ncbi:MAG: phosphoenolpyruvate synthase [Dehalobacterium sp.]
MEKHVLYFSEIDRSHLPQVGGKGANLGEMTKAGFPVPQGFCVTTGAYRTFMRTSREMKELFDLLDRLSPDNLEQIRSLGQRIRAHLHALAMPEDIKASILEAWKTCGATKAYAVRSSATAEDLPAASFAGQQETYLNVRGQEQLLLAVQKCWASLFTDRAISYRAKNGFHHRAVFLSVVVQEMVFPEVSGIMFTADPITGHRKTISIDAGFGLGEALVSGLVTADLYQVRSQEIIKKQIARKKIAIYGLSEGGTVTKDLPREKQEAQALPDDKISELARLGQKIEVYYRSEQDIEWCLAEEKFYVVQSRPITSLYPVPHAPDDKLHLFISIGHAQMMTEAIKPLGISVLRTLVPVGKNTPQAESRLLSEAGGRLYLDMNAVLEYPQARKRLPELLGNVDELIGRTLREFLEREDFLEGLQPGQKMELGLVKKVFPTAFAVLRNILYRQHGQVFNEMNRFIAENVQENSKKLQEVSGADRITLVQEMLPAVLAKVLPKAAPYMGSALITYKLIEGLSKKWLGDAAELAGISKSPPGNVTSEMGLALGDLADAVRRHPAVMEYLKQARDDTFLAGLSTVPGGKDVLPMFQHFFARYGMRGTGEIDITRPRWREAPTQLVPALLSHIKGGVPGQHRLNFQAGKEEAERASGRMLDRLKQVPGGFLKARPMQRLIKVHRALIGIREHPKYFIVQNLDLIKQAILQEVAQLVEAGVLDDAEDVFWFSLQEIKEMIERQQADPDLISERKAKFHRDQKLTPPRAITSAGEIVTVKPGAHVPPGALAGSPVSAGRVEGRARVILRLEEASLEKGDILVAPYTDPAWTPLFPLAAGLITEVGGLMTHGAVVAREYGIPAVVGVDEATHKIQSGQKIGVDGTQGFVEILE